MLLVGIDVAILAAFGFVIVIVSYVFSCMVGFSQEEGSICVSTASVVVLLMIVGYVVMASVLDALVSVL